MIISVNGEELVVSHARYRSMLQAGGVSMVAVDMDIIPLEPSQNVFKPLTESAVQSLARRV